jgi:alpha 1,2-mannosyltransferase
MLRPFLRSSLAKTTLVALCIITIMISFRWRHLPTWHSFTNKDGNTFGLEREIEFWRLLQPLLDLNPPGCAPPKRLGEPDRVNFDPANSVTRPELLSMPAKDVDKMRHAHENFVNAIMAKIPQGSYMPGTRGLVSTAGGSYLPVFVVSLRMLRRSGSSLPMEIFLSSPEDYEEHICQVVLPSLNARCIVLSEILGSSVHITRFQFKIFAIIFSSFEDLLFVDADSFTLHDPEQLLTTEPFKSTGLVTWPDFWMNTASPLYYQISSQPPPSITLQASSEAGELLISKRMHHLSLLLATYYNYYGPSHYYALLSQGGPGEGDKETFIAAATALGKSYYATNEQVRAIGHRNGDGRMTGSAMVQYDPAEDYRLTHQAIDNSNVTYSPRPFFIHANFPKFNPATIFDPSEAEPTRGPHGQDSRAWIAPEDTIRSFGYDVERSFWEEIKWVGCELEDKFLSWKGKSGICDRITKYWDNVFGSTMVHTWSQPS